MKSHANGQKHKEFEINMKSGKQLTLHSFNRPKNETTISNVNVPSCSKIPSDEPRPSASSVVVENLEQKASISSFMLKNDNVTKAEIFLAAYCVTSTHSGATAASILPLLFPDSTIASKIRLLILSHIVSDLISLNLPILM